MQSANTRSHEAQTRVALQRLHVLDTAREPEFDALVTLAAHVCGTPVALLSLVDANRQWYKASVGFQGITQTPRNTGFCAHAVLGTSILEIPDTHLDSRYADNPLVTGAPGIRFYAGAPIALSDGSNVGAVCVIDHVPRALDDSQRAVLANLAVIAASLLEGRSAVLHANETARQAQRAASVLKHSTEAVVGMSVDLTITWVNAAAEALFAQPGHALIGRSFAEYVPTQERDAFHDRVRQATVGEVGAHEARRRCKSGVLLEVSELIVKKTNLDGDVVGFVVFIRDMSERLEAAHALSSKESELRFLFDNLIAGVFVHGPDGAVLQSNPRAAQLLGLSEEVMSGKQLIDPAWHFVRQDGTRMPLDEYPVARVMQSGEPVQGLVLGVVSPSMKRRTWLLCDANRERADAPLASRIIVTVVDITRLIEVEHSLERSQQTLRDMFDNALEPILLGKPDGTITAANPAACKMLGMDAAEICKLGRQGIIDTEHVDFKRLTEARGLDGAAQGELQMIRHGGERFTAEVSSSVYRQVSGELVSSMFFRDISARKAAEALTARLTYFDELTGLANRRYLLDKLKHSLAAAVRRNRVGGVIFIDLDNFKQINDARGHLVGDALLQSVATRLRSCVRADDSLARLGGDEFVVLMDDLGSDLAEGAHNAALAAEKFRHAVDHVFKIGNQTYKTTGSLGITLFPRESQEADDVLREADTAMYRAKSNGRNRIAFFGATMQAEVESRLLLEYDLSEALKLGQLEAFVQPQFSAGGAQVGGEILLRWHHPTRGNVSPVDFIPVAEDTGLILPIGDWVLRQAVAALKRMQAMDPRLSLSVNVSPRQFLQENFVPQLSTLLDASGVPGSSLILEVTEGLLLQEWDEIQNRVRQLLEKQIRLSIDDFGTGYSSLAYLKRLPLYELKIDRGFVSDIPNDANDVAIVESILSIAKHLGFKVVAEGVETASQVEFLVSHGCDVLQGYLFARPMPLEDWIASLRPAASAVTNWS